MAAWQVRDKERLLSEGVLAILTPAQCMKVMDGDLIFKRVERHKCEDKQGRKLERKGLLVSLHQENKGFAVLLYFKDSDSV